MARLKGEDRLDDLAGRLADAFNAATLRDLQAKFEASAPEAKKVLADFYKAADALKTRESEFNRRAKPAKPDLKGNLRSADHFTAIKTFQTAKQGLLDVNAVLGEKIADMVEKNIAAPPKPTAKKSFRAAQNVPA